MTGQSYPVWPTAAQLHGYADLVARDIAAVHQAEDTSSDPDPYPAARDIVVPRLLPDEKPPAWRSLT
ncbi:hypothetical protein [Streptomyces sp. NPDC088739]|uniref:hypothetical protein n=1 Tax=Streptomyces sp. NPDC088739 TaxID=3365882 RepID=UPI0038097162